MEIKSSEEKERHRQKMEDKRNDDGRQIKKESGLVCIKITERKNEEMKKRKRREN